MYAFVYGTLKRGCPNHYVLEAEENGLAQFICEAQTCEKFPLIIFFELLVPFLLDKPGHRQNVQGELYKIDEEMLATLDKFERIPDIYKRRSEQVKINITDSENKNKMPKDLIGKERVSAWNE